MAKRLDSTSPLWWTLAQILIWILQQVERPPQDAEQFCNELKPKIIEEALKALTRALFNVICGAVKGLPVVAARVLCGHYHKDLATLFPLPPSPTPGAMDTLMDELRQFIVQSDVEYNPVWGKRAWPCANEETAPTPARPTESAEPIPAVEPGPEESQPPNKSDLVAAPTPAGPVRSFNVGYVDPAIAHALVHATKRARPAVPPSEPAPATDVRDLAGDTNPSQPPHAQRQPQQPTNEREPNSGDAQSQPQSPKSPITGVPKLSGKRWVSNAYDRKPNELLAMGITGASEALAEESKTAPDCAKPLTARYIEKLLRGLGTFPKAPRGSLNQRPK
jgi:hypothetical protein